MTTGLSVAQRRAMGLTPYPETACADLEIRLRDMGLWEPLVDRAKRIGVDPLDVLGRRRFKELVRIRHWLWSECVARGMSLSGTGRLFAVDHTTVIGALEKHAKSLMK